jgi:hypothetical protein
MLKFSELIPQLVRLYKEYGPTYRLWIMGFPEVLVTDPDDVEVGSTAYSHTYQSSYAITLFYNIITYIYIQILSMSGFSRIIFDELIYRTTCL